LEPEAWVSLGMVLPLTRLEQAFKGASALQASNLPFRIQEAVVNASGADVEAELMLAGGICGRAGVQAGLAFRDQDQAVGLVRTELGPGDSARLTESGVDAAAFVTAVAGAPRVPLPLAVSGLREAGPALAAALSRPSLEVSARVSAARAGAVSARGEDLVARIEARTSLRLRPR
jgi:hypothetical protein